jgi:hypothetical protein
VRVSRARSGCGAGGGCDLFSWDSEKLAERARVLRRELDEGTVCFARNYRSAELRVGADSGCGRVCLEGYAKRAQVLER